MASLARPPWARPKLAVAPPPRPKLRCACTDRIHWSAQRNQWIHTASAAALCDPARRSPRGPVALPTGDVR